MIHDLIQDSQVESENKRKRQGTPRRGNEHIAQGGALGYALAGPSARSLNACQLQVNTCACLNDHILEEQKKREAAP